MLKAPAGLSTRPTSDRLRETLFNVLAPRIEGASFLDLYAGSGANGIEALSRGAARVVFVERATTALTAIRANLAGLRIAAGRFQVLGRSAGAWLTLAAKAEPLQRFDLIFLDPPYDLASEYAATLGLLGGAAAHLLAMGALVIAEHRRARSDAQADAPGDRYGSLVRMRLLEQGDAALSFYQSTADSPA